LSTSSATISFSTSEVTSAAASYTANVSCPCTDAPSMALGTLHTITLSGLAQDTTYQFVVKATDGSGNLQVSAPSTFRTAVQPPDAIPPTIALAGPSAGNVSGTVVVAANASDNVGVTSVQFKVDGVDLGAAVLAQPYTISWDTTTVADGAHTLTAEARDTANNLATASVVVTVRNHPVDTSNAHYVDLDGVDDYLQVADANDLSFGNGGIDSPLTFELWFRPNAMGKQQLLGKWAASNAEYKLHIASGVLRLDLYDNSARAMVSAYTGSQTALIGSWHHLAVTYDGRGGATAANGITIYIDGVAVAVSRINNPAYVAMENLTASIQIGRESTSFKQFAGGLDELRLWNVARTAGEIQSALATELSGGEPGLVAYWRFNEGTGPTATDDSPADHTAALFNGTVWVLGGPIVN
jgi:Concanavalin A-like lectin/glucanases superfamily/Bacterial Ig domain